MVFVLVGSSCVSATSSSDQISKVDCNDAPNEMLAGSVCHSITVPLDYAEKDGAQISLFVREFPALESKRGTVLLLAGGPGESGASFYADVEFFRDTFSSYDIIVPDHRGTGYSTKLCEPEETAKSEGGLSLVGDEWGSCFGQFYSDTARAHAFNLNNAAQDVASIIDTLQLRDDIFIYGVSYGTSLSLAVAEQTDAKLTGIILDSLTPLPSDTYQSLGYRSQLTDRVGRQLLNRCASDPSCPLGQNATDILRDLLVRIDSGESFPILEGVPNGDLRQFLGMLLDVPAARVQIPSIIAAMASNDEAVVDKVQNVTQTYEAFLNPILSFEQSVGSIPLTSLMSGSEFNARKDLTTEQVASEAASLLFTSPLPTYLAANQFPLYAPKAIEPSRTSLPPILVFHGTMDPKTSYEGAMRRIEELRAFTEVEVITLIDAPHAAYLTSKDCLSAPLRNFTKDTTSIVSRECVAEDVRLLWQ